MSDTGMRTDMAGMSDAELVEAARAGEKDAFNFLVERHYGLAHGIAFSRLKNVDSAEEIAQEAFVRAYLLLDRLESPKRFPAWLGRIARNLAIDRLRRGNRRVELFDMIPIDSLPDDPADETPDARQSAATAEEHDALYEALKKLPPEQLEIVLLHYMEEMTHREIGKRLGVSASTVTRRLRACMKELRKEMDPALRESLSRIRPGMKARAKTIALVGIVASLPEPSRAALARAAAPALDGGLHSSMEYSLLKGTLAAKAKAICVAGAVGIGIGAAAFFFFGNTRDGRPRMIPRSERAPAPAAMLTPEAAIAAFTSAIARGDGEAALACMHPQSPQAADVAKMIGANESSPLNDLTRHWKEIGPDATLMEADTVLSEDEATVRWTSPESNDTFKASLVRVDGRWLITEF